MVYGEAASQELKFAQGTVTAVVLGIMQDGGLPHAGCRCERCVAAFRDPTKIKYTASLGIVDNRTSTSPAAVYLIDATPDIKFQLNLLADALGAHPQRPHRLRQPDAIFLTHAHMGHIGGLPQLGPESMAVSRLPVYASAPLGQLLQSTPVWQPLVENLRIVPLQPGQYVDLALDIQVTAVPVPHRDEWGVGTFAYKIQGAKHSLLYVPDIDSWEAWPEAEEMLSSVDIALVDASFYSQDELNGRSSIAHPLVTDTLQMKQKFNCELILTHLNHTNPILDSTSSAYAQVLKSGITLAYQGQQIQL